MRPAHESVRRDVAIAAARPGWTGPRGDRVSRVGGLALHHLSGKGAAAALVKFAQLDGARSLLGKGWLRFDMRDPAKLVARKPGADMEHQVPDGDGAAIDPERLARVGDA